MNATEALERLFEHAEHWPGQAGHGGEGDDFKLVMEDGQWKTVEERSWGYDPNPPHPHEPGLISLAEDPPDWREIERARLRSLGFTRVGDPPA